MAEFVDEVTVAVRGGRGGNGSASFERQPFKPRGRPDGGSGGKGGDVVLEVSADVYDLSYFSWYPHHRADDGEPGHGNNRTGAAGEDVVIPVPDGTVVHDDDGEMADLIGPGARAVAARGGRGGRGNAALASRRDRAPRVAESGERGEERRLRLELRLVADVGLVGLPNAGKSTLLAALTAARPKIADYPFTTLSPNLGVAGGEGERYVVADVPGLVEGAHQGKGLGDRFLRHVSRSRVLAYVVDLAAEDPVADLETVRAEVRAFDPEVAARPWIVVATKRDLVGARDAAAAAKRLGALGETLVVSGTTGEGTQDLAVRLARLAGEAPAPARTARVVIRPGREPFTVSREGERFRVEGRLVERWVAETDFDDPRSVVRLQDRFRKQGVERRLAEAGARRGDEVLIGPMAFDYEPEDG